MKVALVASERELPVFSRCLPRFEGVEWIGSHVHAIGGPSSARGIRMESQERPPLFASADLLFASADVVLVSGSVERRFDHVSRALRKGKPVWSAWPLGKDAAECAKLAALADEACVPNQVCHLSRRNPVFQAALPYAGKGRLIRALIGGRRMPAAGIGTFMEREFFPCLDRVAAVWGTSVRKIRVKTVSFAALPQAELQLSVLFHSGAEACFWIDRLATRPWNRMQIAGPGFLADLDFKSPSVVIRQEESGGTEEVAESRPSMEMVFPMEADLKDFLQSVSQSRRGNLTFAESAKVQELFLQIVKQVRANG